jgi:tetratricopeptide (TPR) repeat protein
VANTQRLKGKVEYHLQRSVDLLQKGDPASALSHSDQQLKLLAKLRAAEPDNDEHLRIEASAYYNRAGILDQLGRVAQAVEAARTALERYIWLGAPAGPEQRFYATSEELGEAVRRRAQHHSGYPPYSEAEQREQLKVELLAADVRVRLARLLAKNGGTAAEAEVRALGEFALDRYASVAEVNRGYASELERIFVQVATARDTIARSHLAAEDVSGAIARWNELLAECVARLGPSHPVTINVRKTIEAVRRLT